MEYRKGGKDENERDEDEVSEEDDDLEEKVDEEDEWENGNKINNNNLKKIETIKSPTFLTNRKSVLKRQNSFEGVCGEGKKGFYRGEQKLREIVLRSVKKK